MTPHHSRNLDFLDGVLPPLTTPFTADGGIDEAALVANIEHYNSTGLSGYVVFGSNGEAVHLSPEERRRVLQVVKRSAAPSMGIVAGVNEQSTRATRLALEEVARGGADVALVITPYFYKGCMDQRLLRTFFLDVAEAAPLPIVLYNVPKNTGVNLAPETVAELSQHPRIVGCKDSSGNVGALASAVRQCAAEFRLLVGNAAVFYPALCMGACGAILAVACAAPEAAVALYAAHRDGDHPAARAWQDRLAPLGTLVTATHGIAGLKACLDLAGLEGGAPRRPLLPLGPQERRQLRQAMVVSGLYTHLSEDDSSREDDACSPSP